MIEVLTEKPKPQPQQEVADLLTWDTPATQTPAQQLDVLGMLSSGP